MKIAIITPALHYGGGEKQVEFLALGLRSRGHSVAVYCFTGEGKIADILRAGDVKVIRLYSRLLSKLIARENMKTTPADAGIYKNKGATAGRICRALNEFYAALRLFFIFLVDKPSVVHLYQNQTKLAILASKAAGVKRIVYTETASIGDWLSPAQISIMRSFWKLCDVVITLSGSMQRHMIDLKAANAENIRLVPTMLPMLSAVQMASGGGKKNSITVGIIGRLTPEKGHIFFLRAAGLIKEAHSGINFVIAGDGHLKDKLIEAAGKMGLGGRVEFTGSFEKIEDIMNRIDILVLSSLTEGLPLVLLEGMAYGKPIVATAVGGVAEIVINGKTGFVVAPKDPQALADAILILAKDEEKRNVFAREAAALYRAKYSSESIIPNIESIYRETKDMV